MKKKNFLTAEWRKLIIINYEVNPAILIPYLPTDCELDFFEGKALVSMVGFMFLNTKVLGIKIPFHVNFEEVNLRFYVKHKHKEEWRRGVVFIKEIVPKTAIAKIANLVYNEPYVTHKMKHNWDLNSESLDIEYSWVAKSKNSMRVKANPVALNLLSNSIEEFITEHYWGYTKQRNPSRTSQFEVSHQRWQIYPIENVWINIHFEENYGKAFGFLKDVEPHSVILAEGSDIRVLKGEKI
jgi:uncharacterized protein